MGLFDRWKAKRQRRQDQDSVDVALLAHLNEFQATRTGVEVWVEAPTGFGSASVLLVAADGEWTRRSVPSVGFGHSFAIEHQLPSYDAGVVGYPQSMRDYDAKRRQQAKQPPLN